MALGRGPLGDDICPMDADNYGLPPYKPSTMELNHAQHILGQFEECAAWEQERNLFFERLCAAEFHWFFVQGLDRKSVV